MTDYNPTPIDTSGVILPPDIACATEVLARHTHEIWARRRLAAGWRYGPRMDDSRKEHPALVPYEDLTEAEKDYDRHTALEALKVMMTLGYRIERG